ncbi:MAG: twin-arginine translocation signal domain-containing protein, partial [Fuerstiella sp.]|nr:twin-arginine translocation signal domain-containing protein [Fuerstiella sp.]
MSDSNQLPSESPSSNASSTASRRQFIKRAATTVGAVAAVTVADTQDAPAAAPTDKIRIGFIGPGSRGFGAHVKRLTKLQLEGEPIALVAVCDVYNEHRDRAAS